MLYYTTQSCSGCCIPSLSRRRISHPHFTTVATLYPSLLYYTLLCYPMLYYTSFYKSGGSMPVSFNKEDLASPSHCTISHLQRWMWNCHLVEQGGVGIPTSQYYAILYYHIQYSLLRRCRCYPHLFQEGGLGIFHLTRLYDTRCSKGGGGIPIISRRCIWHPRHATMI